MAVPLPTSAKHVERLAHKLSVLKELGLKPAPAAFESARLDRNTYEVSAVRPAMGTLVSVVTIHASEAQTHEAINEAFSEMDRLVGHLSRFDPSSAVSVLNQQGQLTDTPPELGHVVSQALEFYRRSSGAFDITVKPLIELLQSGEPARSEWDAALELVGSTNVEQTGRGLRFKRSGMGITLDGIAKGYIVDRIGTVLQRHGVVNFLINAGGDIRTAGTKESGLPWTVAVQDPLKQDEFPDIIHMKEGAVATSGSYEHRFRHIVDSETGHSPAWSTSVTVTAPTALAADALATALYAMEPTEGSRLIGSLPGCECLNIDNGGKPRKSRGWRSAKRTLTRGR
jgi:thiamine biosynthesis lipoprotein